MQLQNESFVIQSWNLQQKLRKHTLCL